MNDFTSAKALMSRTGTRSSPFLSPQEYYLAGVFGLLKVMFVAVGTLNQNEGAPCLDPAAAPVVVNVLPSLHVLPTSSSTSSVLILLHGCGHVSCSFG